MINVVLDTNVIVASLLRQDGSNRRALRKVIARPDVFRICYSSLMIAEYEDVLTRPIITARGLAEEAGALLSLIRDVGDEIVPKPVYALVYPDRKDRPFLEAAVYVDGVLITNNTRDFPFAGVTVLAPEDFLTWCEEESL